MAHNSPLNRSHTSGGMSRSPSVLSNDPTTFLSEMIAKGRAAAQQNRSSRTFSNTLHSREHQRASARRIIEEDQRDFLTKQAIREAQDKFVEDNKIELTEKLKTKLTPKVETELKEALAPEVRKYLRQTLAPEVKHELRLALAEQVKGELRSTLKPRVWAHLREDLCDQVVQQLRHEYAEEMREQACEDLRDELYHRVEEEVRCEWISKIKAEGKEGEVSLADESGAERDVFDGGKHHSGSSDSEGNINVESSGASPGKRRHDDGQEHDSDEPNKRLRQDRIDVEEDEEDEEEGEQEEEVEEEEPQVQELPDDQEEFEEYDDEELEEEEEDGESGEEAEYDDMYGPEDLEEAQAFAPLPYKRNPALELNLRTGGDLVESPYYCFNSNPRASYSTNGSSAANAISLDDD